MSTTRKTDKVDRGYLRPRESRSSDGKSTVYIAIAYTATATTVTLHDKVTSRSLSKQQYEVLTGVAEGFAELPKWRESLVLSKYYSKDEPSFVALKALVFGSLCPHDEVEISPEALETCLEARAQAMKRCLGKYGITDVIVMATNSVGLFEGL